ncbi:MAG: LLM class F420-dependent oxidoreductase [Vulcanimicrobiota bacterium]
MAIRIGVQLHPQHCTYDELAKAAQEVDQLGCDTLWTWDHFYPLYGSPDAPMGPQLPPAAGDPPNRHGHFEGWTLLAAFACVTKKVEIGMLVTCNTYRNPQLLADMARTLDHISHGRAILGVGSGWYEKDYQEYDYEFGTAVSRLKDLARDLPIMKERLGKLHPAPVRNPLPIMIGGGGEKMTLRIVAEHAHIWNGFGTPDVLAHKNKVLDDWCAKVGRDPKEIERSVLMTQPDALDVLDGMYEAGIRHFIYGTGIPFDLDPAKRLLEWRESKLAHA